ncbi:MAG: hypothetical protein AVDCRST_MAG53-1765 [uncultured Solirubrobacteraceae bacterium]|uniref:PH domain-containing protein n=1 Tax=uncultured Solirubrobacteraceae bacterium TaxID=1162706 RepID=A0A6J4SC39_9ACTN|nr:MAG: hypothetical protein AVDCRST_MAG53-1765 [uncultured Solirubrobacteraceae bacterium]
MSAPVPSGTVRYEPATVRGTLGRLTPYLVAAGALLVVNETTDLLGGDSFLTWFALGLAALVLGLLAFAYAKRGNLALEFGPDALRAGRLVLPWQRVTRVELAYTRTHLEAEEGVPTLPWLLFAVEDATGLEPSMSQRQIAKLLGEEWADVGVSAGDLPVAPEDLLGEVRRRAAAARAS